MSQNSSQFLYGLSALRAIEQHAEKEGIDLMARASSATVDWVCQRYNTNSHILVAAGVGNNGGDALFAAEILYQRGYTLSCIVLSKPISVATKTALARCEALGIEILTSMKALQENCENTVPNVIIDGLLGIGLSRVPDAELAELITFINELKNKRQVAVLALDVPSGLDAETGCAPGVCIQANSTLTFLGHKVGLWTADGVDAAGEVFLEDLDESSNISQLYGELNTKHTATLNKMNRPKNSHKGRFGSASIVGGNIGMLGASLLAGRSALAAGVGKVWLNVLDRRLAVDPCAPELMIHSSMDHVDSANAIAIGPGLGQDAQAFKMLETVLKLKQTPVVIDADALNIIAKQPQFLECVNERGYCAVLTPHPTEAARLLDCSTTEIQSNRVKAAQTIANKYKSVTVLKGAGSIIAQPNGHFKINTTGGSALAVAGQGDVLSGVIVALLAQGIEPFDAACLAVYVHGLAGDYYEESQSNGAIGLSAHATVPLISKVMNQLLSAAVVV